jgi:hypothetical protein
MARGRGVPGRQLMTLFPLQFADAGVEASPCSLRCSHPETTSSFSSLPSPWGDRKPFGLFRLHTCVFKEASSFSEAESISAQCQDDVPVLSCGCQGMET